MFDKKGKKKPAEMPPTKDGVVITRKNGPFGEVGRDHNGNPPGYGMYFRTHDWIDPCDQFPGGVWLTKGTWKEQ